MALAIGGRDSARGRQISVEGHVSWLQQVEKVGWLVYV